MRHVKDKVKYRQSDSPDDGRAQYVEEGDCIVHNILWKSCISRIARGEITRLAVVASATAWEWQGTSHGSWGFCHETAREPRSDHAVRRPLRDPVGLGRGATGGLFLHRQHR